MSCAIAGAQQISGSSKQSSSPTDSETRAGGNFNNSFASSEFAFNAGVIVQGAPFSAVAIKETTQILSDGRRFVRRMTASIYRDSEGRTRHEWGNETKTPEAGRVPMIYDAVTGGIYFLDPSKRRVSQLSSPVKEAVLRQVKVITPQSPPEKITQVLGETIEPLGTKSIEGVTVEGVRVTTTIRGTEKSGQPPAKVIYEHWYSQELRRSILIKVTDPRFGEASYRLIKIDRKEPPRELFIVPTDYQLDSRKSREPEGRLATVAPVSVRLERGGKVTVDNRTTGRIVIIGWDKDTVEARATSERGVEAVRFSVRGDSSDRSVWLKADYAKVEKPETRPDVSLATPVPSLNPENPAPLSAELPRQARLPEISSQDTVIDPPMRDDRPLEVHLEVRVPRYAEIEVIKVIRSHVEVTGVETPVVVLGDKGDVILKNVGAVEVRTRTGAVGVDNTSGLVDVVTASGPVRVRHVRGDVRVLSIGGQVEIECARGRVNVDSASGLIRLDNIFGDVDANTSNSDVFFTGALRKDGRYHLKSMSGAVEMSLRDNPPGFTAALSSYRGLIENQFQLKIKQASPPEEAINRRIIGRYGDGQAQITLDTFDGKVKLSKLAPGAVKDCQ
ncbi:MAG: DUF4097 family beta strand repeat protein [Acidobacteria bacterium]|nr:DUF4097 family beta strand repeat protein [Acidobacteriota bacterium]